MSSPVTHFEFAARDRQKLSDFYARLFGWQQNDWPDAGYTVMKAANGRGIDGGIADANEMPPGVMVYAEVADVDKALKQAVALGAEALAGPLDYPDVGRIAIFADPEGNRTGLWKPVAKK